MVEVGPVRWAPAGALRLAYQEIGSGPEVVLSVPPLAQNIELAWERPEIARMLRRFGSFCRFVQFDKRGTGASDRSAEVAGLDDRLDDMLAVLDAAGVEQAHLYGVSDGGPTAILMAVTHPDRVRSLVLDSTAACFRIAEDIDRMTRRSDMEAVVDAWGTERSRTLDVMAPSLADDPEYRSWQPRYERQAATPTALRALMEMNAIIDVRPLLPDVAVPTLQLHRTGDRAVSVALARTTAAAIPGARFVELPGDDHYSFAGDADPWFDEIESFITGRDVRGSTVFTRPATAPDLDAADEPSAPIDTRIRTLGGFAVVRDGVEILVGEWGSRRARQLCKRLVISAGQAVPRDQLVELLWPDDPEPERLGPRLSVLLSTVRRVLGGGVVADRAAVRLDPEVCAVDVVELRRAHDRGDDDAVVSAYETFLPEDVYEDWTSPTRDELRHLFLASAVRLLEAAGDDPATALGICDRILAADPHHDLAHRRRIRTLAVRGELGTAQAAHDAYDAYVAAMDELGMVAASFESVVGDLLDTGAGG